MRTQHDGAPSRLAVDGGAPVRAQPYDTGRGVALWGREEEEAALEVVRSRSLFRYYGPQLLGKADAFEEEFAAMLGVEHVVGVSSGTAALACGLVGLGLPEGAEVIVPAVTFVGSVNAVVWARGVAVFAEVDDSLTLDPSSVADAVTDRTWGIMPVHLGNVAADMDPLLEVARRHDLRVIEDAAQAAGVRYQGRRVGSIGHAGAFSFQLDKNVTCGEGGAVATDDGRVDDRSRRYQDQGGQFTTSKGEQRGSTSEEAFLGVNLRMTELSAALLSVQLRRLDSMLVRLRGAARTIKAELSDLGLRWRRVPDEEGSAGDATILLGSRLDARRWVTALNAEGIPAQTLYRGQAVYANPAVRAGRSPWRTTATRVARCPVSEQLLGGSVTIGLGASMSDEDVIDVVVAIRKVAAAVGGVT